MREHKTPDPTIAVRVPPHVRDWLVETAQRHKQKPSEYLRDIIVRAMEAHRG